VDEDVVADPVTARFAENLRRLRRDAGLTQDALAEIVGMAAAEISRLERGRRDPQQHTIVRLVRGLDVSAAELLEKVT
jgi:transcriptional regulator with XRE-family HTH domain